MVGRNHQYFPVLHYFLALSTQILEVFWRSPPQSNSISRWFSHVETGWSTGWFDKRIRVFPMTFRVIWLYYMPYMPYPLVMTNIAIENDHRNSGFPINNGDGKFPGELAHWPQMAPGHYWGCKFGTPESEGCETAMSQVLPGPLQPGGSGHGSHG